MHKQKLKNIDELTKQKIKNIYKDTLNYCNKYKEALTGNDYLILRHIEYEGERKITILE